jgi:hypothetical protein
MFEDVLLQQSAPAGPAHPRRFMRFVLPGILILICISAVAVIFFAMQQRSGPPSGQNLSFYPEGMQTEQLALDKEFSEKKTEQPVSQVEIPLEPVETRPAAETVARPESGAKPTVKPAEQPAEKPAEKPATPVRRDVEPVKTEVAKPIAAPVNRPRQDKPVVSDNRSWDEAQPLALEAGVAGRWSDAAAIWRGPVSRLMKGSYTVLVSQSDKGSFVSSVFERFANNANLRDQFFITTSARTFNICWGFFPDRAAAQRGLQSLPERVMQFKPVVRPLDDLR